MLNVYLEACAERYENDREYKRRLQLELFNTDAQRSIRETLEAVRFRESLRVAT